MENYKVTGMTCASCQSHVEKAVSKVPGVENVTVSLLTNSMTVEGTASQSDIIEAVKKAGYGAESKNAAANTPKDDMLKDTETPKLKKRLIASVGFLIILMYITMGHNMLGWPLPTFLNENYIALAITQMLIAIIVMMINNAFFKSGFRSLFHGTPNMDALVALGSGVSFGWSLFVLYKMTAADPETLKELYRSQLYFESAAMIPALITVGKTLESISKGRTTDALKSLMKMSPETAVIEVDGKPQTVGIDEVKTGDIFIVKPGEKIPVDGVITEGETAVDESALTGESMPVDKTAGDRVSAATISKSGFIKARATRVGEDTSFAQIIKMVSDAAATKAPIARIADRVSGVFVPAVIGIAIAVLIIWLVAGRETAYALERAISVLVISCPCALGLATPVAIMVGNGVGARNGILFKTAEALENTGKINIAALDKTGTITAGKPEVTDIIAVSTTEEELLLKAYSLELKSEHPLAGAIVEVARKQGLSAVEIENFRVLSGNGLQGTINGKKISGGSLKFIETLSDVSGIRDKAQKLAEEGKTPMVFEEDGSLLGLIAVADVIKDDSEKAIAQLKNMGVEVVMLTGDNERTAKAIGAKAGVDDVIAGVLPGGKESAVRKLKKRGRTAMVGDGINDAPALTTADTGIAIGAGTDAAIDSADVVLMNSRLSDAAAAVRLSRVVLRNIYENLFWAFAYNIILIPMAAGLYPGIQMKPMWGAAAMALSSFTVCMNALRLNLVKVHDASHDRKLKNRTKITEEKTMEKTIVIEGMMCPMCEKHTRTALEAIEGVEVKEVSHDKGVAVVEADASVADEVLTKAVTDAGYTVKGIN